MRTMKGGSRLSASSARRSFCALTRTITLSMLSVVNQLTRSPAARRQRITCGATGGETRETGRALSLRRFCSGWGVRGGLDAVSVARSLGHLVLVELQGEHEDIVGCGKLALLDSINVHCERGSAAAAGEA
jgi:hypothetical protein